MPPKPPQSTARGSRALRDPSERYALDEVVYS